MLGSKAFLDSLYLFYSWSCLRNLPFRFTVWCYGQHWDCNCIWVYYSMDRAVGMSMLWVCSKTKRPSIISIFGDCWKTLHSVGMNYLYFIEWFCCWFDIKTLHMLLWYQNDIYPDISIRIFWYSTYKSLFLSSIAIALVVTVSKTVGVFFNLVANLVLQFYEKTFEVWWMYMVWSAFNSFENGGSIKIHWDFWMVIIEW